MRPSTFTSSTLRNRTLLIIAAQTLGWSACARAPKPIDIRKPEKSESIGTPPNPSLPPSSESGQSPADTSDQAPPASSSADPQTQTNESASRAGDFVHPGILIDRKRIDFIKAQIKGGVEPFASAFKLAKGGYLADPNYKLRGVPDGKGSNGTGNGPAGVIECGSYSKPDYGCSSEKDDAAAAYTQALMWVLTDKESHAKNAILIMNEYAKNLKGGHKGSNGPLQAAWVMENFPAAAEIIRHTSKLWSKEDISKFETMLKTQYLPSISGKGGAGKNGNWQLSMADGMMGIAVFTDDRELFNKAVGIWKAWVPAYYYSHKTDGGKPVKIPDGPRDWNGQDTFTQAMDGVSQETCRDIQHVGLGMGATFNAAETAFIQGIDLYALERNRLTAALEFHARLLMGTGTKEVVKDVPAGFPGLCTGSGSKVKVVVKGTMERAYNAYKNRLRIDLPQTRKHLEEDIRPAAIKNEYVANDFHSVIWETLTHAGHPL